MVLKLVYNENLHTSVNAAFIPGANSYDWLAEIGRWGVDMRAIRCFVLPQSISSNQAGGVFVIFNNEAIASKLTLRFAYTEIAPGFYTPVYATLSPAITSAELSAIKLWDIQVFHPSIGLTGFEQKDEFKLDELIEISEEFADNWLPAYPLPQAAARLNAISLEPEEMPFDPNALVEQLPLSEIPEVDKEQHTPLKKGLRLLSIIALWLLLIVALVGKIIFAMIGVFFEKRSSSPVSSESQGLFSHLEAWVNKRLKSIDKQRDTELNRLVKLFDKNNDEALQYAIPLNSPYLNRGTAATKSVKLSRRSLNFNFKSFGGGGTVDYWDLGEYRLTLRQQYMKSLNAAIDKGDYKKAAYIYAHLLGDLLMAAQTLQNGKHYREAAAIYKNHLNNQSKAAECLENGGIINEAIPIYVELGNYEKAGDLHKQLGQDVLANKYYSDTVNRALDAKDYLNAARLKTDKMGQGAEGESILLNGWKDDNHPEECLAKYFDMQATEMLHDKVKDVYNQHVGLRRKTAFLKILADLLPKNKHQQFRETAIDIGYEVIHQQVSRGDNSGLKLLSKFMPDDRLLAQDTSRYILQNHEKPSVVFASSYLELRQDTQWLTVINYHDQLLGIGIKKEELHIFRANWEGRIAYNFVFLLTGENPFFRLTADAQLSQQVLLTGNAVPAGLHNKMASFSFFEKEVDLFQINWQLPNTLGYGLKANRSGIFILHIDGSFLCIDEFSHQGSLLKKIVCSVPDDWLTIYDMPFLRNSELYWRKEHFYFIGQDRLMRVDEKGQLEMLPLDAEVIAFSVSSPHAALKIAIITTSGCIVVSPGINEMEITKPIFAGELQARFVRLMPDNYLVIANEELAMVYDISKTTPKLICEIQPEKPIRAILNVPKQHHFALLEEGNRISVHNLSEKIVM